MVVGSALHSATPGCRVETRKPQGDAKSPRVHSAEEGGGMEGLGCHCLGGPSPGSQQLPSASIPARSSSARRKWTQWAGKPHLLSHRGSGEESRAPGRAKAAACLNYAWAKVASRDLWRSHPRVF